MFWLLRDSRLSEAMEPMQETKAWQLLAAEALQNRTMLVSAECFRRIMDSQIASSFRPGVQFLLGLSLRLLSLFQRPWNPRKTRRRLIAKLFQNKTMTGECVR